jgi:hypothetical protein
MTAEFIADAAPVETMPPCVDLDGTLVLSDTLAESLAALRPGWRHCYALAKALAAGRAAFKARVAAMAALDPARLPYNEALLRYLRMEKARGRYLVLATAAHRDTATAIADHLGLFDEVIATADARNLKGTAKAEALIERFGKQGFADPLEALHDWNRLYGARGMTQYQCVLPKAASRSGIAAILDRVADSGCGSPLAVLKLFGAEGEGLLSFPMEGYTLSLDCPVNDASLAPMRELGAIVMDHGGRLYLAKDARAGPGVIARGYKRLPEFAAVRARRSQAQVHIAALREARAVSKVLIVGAASDIGRAIASAYAKAGRGVILAARDAPRLRMGARSMQRARRSTPSCSSWASSETRSAPLLPIPPKPSA